MKDNQIVIPIVVMLAILTILLLFMCLPIGQATGHAERGIMDFRDTDLNKRVYQLTGEWQYTPGELYTPETFPVDAPFIALPENWGGSGDYLNTCATYRLIVRTNDIGLLTLYIPEIYTAYNLYVNGEYIRGAGVVSCDPENGEPSFESVLVPVKSVGGKVEITIQASNYHWMRPHMNNVIKLAGNDKMYSWFYRTRALYFLAMGFILAAAFYHVALYIMRRKMQVYLLFSLLCFVCFWRLALETDGLSDLTGWFSTSSGELDARVFLVLFFLHGLFIAMFSLFVFGRDFIAKYFLPAVAYGVVGVVALSVLPMNAAWITLVFSVITMLPMLIALYKALRSPILRDNKTMWLYVLALVLYIVVGFASKYFADHLLFMTPVLTNMYMVMAQSLILARQYAEMKETEQTLQEKNEAIDRLSRMKTEFFQNINHDLKAPLTVVSTYIANVVSQFDHEIDEQDARESLLSAQSEIMRMARMVSSATNYSLQNDNRHGMEPLDVAPLLRGGVKTYRALLENHGNTLNIFVPEALPHIFANADTLLLVLANLLSNANRHTRGGEINVAASCDAGCIAVTVRDNGEGVNPDIMPHIYERGISDAGTGLGLSICKTAIESLGGTIKVESEYGEGSTVTILLPVYRKVEDNE